MVDILTHLQQYVPIVSTVEERVISSGKKVKEERTALRPIIVGDYHVKHVAEEAEIDKNVACDVMNWFREVCSTRLLQTTMASSWVDLERLSR